jgi:hypothetical protein
VEKFVRSCEKSEIFISVSEEKSGLEGMLLVAKYLKMKGLYRHNSFFHVFPNSSFKIIFGLSSYFHAVGQAWLNKQNKSPCAH